MAPNNPSMRDLIKLVEARYSTVEPEMIPVKEFGNVIGHVWQEGPSDWHAEESMEGMSWGMIDTQAEAEELIRDVYDEVDHYKSTVEEDNSEKLLYPPTVYDGEGNEKSYDIYHTVMNTKRVGDTVSSSAAAPGMGGTVHRITRMDDTGVYGIKIEDSVQIMEPWMVEGDISKDYFVKEPVHSSRNMEDVPKEGAYPIRITAKELITQYGLYLNPGDTKYLEPTNITGDEYSDKWGKTWDWDWILHLKQSGQVELEVGGDLDQTSNDPTFRNNLEENEHECAQCGRPADGNEELCSECAGGFYESSKPYAGKGNEPYATMKDGPDKYLFRKDGKQKLVGSVDNEKECPECEGTGEAVNSKDSYYCARCNGTGIDKELVEELKEQLKVGDKITLQRCKHKWLNGLPAEIIEIRNSDNIVVKSKEGMHILGPKQIKHKETNMNKEIREMQIAAGIIVAEDETVEEGKLPDALKKHQFGAKDDDDSADDDSADDDSADDKDEVDEDVANWMKRFNMLTPVNEDKHRKGAGKTECEYCNSKDCDYDCDESQAGGFDESINEDCPTDPDKNADGECSPLTHIELDEDDFEDEDSRDIEPFLNDEEYEMVAKAMATRGHTPHSLGANRKGQIMAKDDLSPGAPEYTFDAEGNIINLEYAASYDPETGQERFEEDIFDEDLLLAPQDAIGPEVDEDDMIYGKTGKNDSDIKWPEEVRTRDVDWPNNDMAEQGPGQNEFSLGYTDDTMIDVGDEEDYKVYDFDSEFETMLGGSSDPVGSYGAGSMYEMNEIRKLAGMEPIEEKKADKDYDGDGKVESEEDEYKGSKDKAIKKELDEEDFGALHSGHLDPIPGDVVAYEINDEKAYYVMADLLGAELDFGPEDEILVPAERNDQIIAALTDQGFIEDEDYRVAGQMMDDLQNGYNDRAFTKGQDYFPRGAQSTPASDLGPSASGMADNPMSNKMRMVKKDEVYETMKFAYRRHRKA